MQGVDIVSVPRTYVGCIPPIVPPIALDEDSGLGARTAAVVSGLLGGQPHILRPSHSPNRRATSATATIQARPAKVQLTTALSAAPRTNAPRPSVLRMARVFGPCAAASRAARPTSSAYSARARVCIAPRCPVR